MNFARAQGAMAAGRKVKLSDWTGYWFSDNGQIKVFTRNGDILDTPNIERYKDRDDWEVTEGAMGFDFAILALKSGKRVARAGWNGKKMFVFMRPGDVLKTGFIPKVKSLPDTVKQWIDENIDDKANQGETGLQDVVFTPYLCLKAADNSIVNGWLASQTDMLAEDWVIV